jgi:2-polyprenyl-3-methyl-5-hydroxy-6-metoxy-1,4-benzoquinol methylase
VTLETSRVRCIVCGGDVALPRAIRFRKNGFEIARCPSCGLLFRLSLPTEEELAQIYDVSYFCSAVRDATGQGYDDYLGDGALHRDTARRRLERLERFVSRGRLLDVGAAAGFFVAEAAARGWDACGIDIADEMVQWGREHLDVALEKQTLRALEAEPGFFDAVTMWDYIEHALDPAADLQRALELLRPGGVVAISTGDAASLAAKVSGARWHLLTPRHHNYFFTAVSLGRLLNRLGFEVVYEGHPGARYSARYLTHKLRTIVDVAPIRGAGRVLVRSNLGSLPVPINLGDIVTVVART